MMEIAGPKYFRVTILQWIIVFAVLQLLVALLTDGFAFSFDEAMWHYIGRNWFRNHLTPYAGGIDNKSPLIFAVFGLSDKLFGVNHWFPRVLGTLVQSAGLYFLYKIAKHFYNTYFPLSQADAARKAGIIAVTLYGLALLWRSTGGKNVSLTETYEITCILLALYLYCIAGKPKHFFLSGMIAGLGIGFRLSACFGALPIFLDSFRKGRPAVIWFVAGVLSSITLLVGILALCGITPNDLWTYCLADNFGAGSVTDRSLPWRIENFNNGFFYSGLILFYPAVILYLFLRKKLDILTVWLICEFIGINIIGIYARPHLKNMLPALALINAITITYLINRYSIQLKLTLIAIWIVFFPKISEPVRNFKKLFSASPDASAELCTAPYPQPDDYSKKMLGRWIKSNSVEQERVLVAGFGAIVQAYSERISPGIYFNVTQTAMAKKRFVDDLAVNKPALIVVPLSPQYATLVSPDIVGFINALVEKEYDFEGCRYGYSVYKRSQNSKVKNQKGVSLARIF